MKLEDWRADPERETPIEQAVRALRNLDSLEEMLSVVGGAAHTIRGAMASEWGNIVRASARTIRAAMTAEELQVAENDAKARNDWFWAQSENAALREREERRKAHSASA